MTTPPAGHKTYFCGGNQGAYQVLRRQTLSGTTIPTFTHLSVTVDPPLITPLWTTSAVSSVIRYTHQAELEQLKTKQSAIGAPQFDHAAMVLISKSEEWWQLPQDERRSIIEEKSQHISRLLDVTPLVARKLYHCRDLGGQFDFVTWFEFEGKHEGMFTEALAYLRSTVEWRYMTAETEFYLRKSTAK